MVARALVGAALVTIFGMPSAVQAQTIDGAAPSLHATLSSAFPTVGAADLQRGVPVQLTRPVTFEAPQRRTGELALRSLYVATATMQMLDVHSTMKALSNGAVEGNPLVAGLVQHRAAFVAAKAGVAAVTIYAANRLARNNKVGAVATMIAINSAYVMVVANNYRNARR